MVYRHKTLFLQNKGFVDINPVEFGYEHCRPFKDAGYDELGHYLIHYVISGKGEFHKNNKEYIVKSGEAFIIKRGETAWYRADEQCPWHYVWIGFEGILAERFNSLNDIFTVPNNIFNKMLEVFERDKMQEEYLISQMFQLYITLFSKQDVENYVDKIRHYIDIHFKKPIKITDIAKEMNMDRKYLAKLFKRETGMTMKGYLIKRKMEYAADLLLRGYAVNEVAEFLSYSEQSVFSNAFYRYWNEYPVQFKESQIKNKDERGEI